MLTIAMETWLHSDVPSKKPSLAGVFLTSLGPLIGADLIELNPASPFSRRADFALQRRISTRPVCVNTKKNVIQICRRPPF